jgi:hypothetical protein
MRKLAKYYDYYGTDLCEKEWLDFRQYRVIVVQRTAERMKNLLKELATQEIHKDNCPSRKGKNCNCKPRTLDHRMFWLSSESAYRENIGGRIFATPKDYAGDNYSFLET